jgi:inhibitor of KinA sporulation pathway (predicted exonuclease)
MRGSVYTCEHARAAEELKAANFFLRPPKQPVIRHHCFDLALFTQKNVRSLNNGFEFADRMWRRCVKNREVCTIQSTTPLLVGARFVNDIF